MALPVGPVGVNEQVRIEVILSAENANDVEIPYSVKFDGSAPVITPVAAA
ncbi:MAG: hypothetical protein V3S29_13175 [bacterium]